MPREDLRERIFDQARVHIGVKKSEGQNIYPMGAISYIMGVKFGRETLAGLLKERSSVAQDVNSLLVIFPDQKRRDLHQALGSAAAGTLVPHLMNARVEPWVTSQFLWDINNNFEGTPLPRMTAPNAQDLDKRIQDEIQGGFAKAKDRGVGYFFESTLSFGELKGIRGILESFGGNLFLRSTIESGQDFVAVLGEFPPPEQKAVVDYTSKFDSI